MLSNASLQALVRPLRQAVLRIAGWWWKTVVLLLGQQGRSGDNNNNNTAAAAAAAARVLRRTGDLVKGAIVAATKPIGRTFRSLASFFRRDFNK